MLKNRIEKLEFLEFMIINEIERNENARNVNIKVGQLINKSRKTPEF